MALTPIQIGSVFFLSHLSDFPSVTHFTDIPLLRVAWPVLSFLAELQYPYAITGSKSPTQPSSRARDSDMKRSLPTEGDDDGNTPSPGPAPGKTEPPPPKIRRKGKGIMSALRTLTASGSGTYESCASTGYVQARAHDDFPQGLIGLFSSSTRAAASRHLRQALQRRARSTSPPSRSGSAR